MQNFFNAIDDTQNIIAYKNLGITGKEVLLDENEHTFNVREAKHQDYHNPLANSSLSNNLVVTQIHSP